MLNHPKEELDKYQYKQKQLIEKLNADLSQSIAEATAKLQG